MLVDSWSPVRRAAREVSDLFGSEYNHIPIPIKVRREEATTLQFSLDQGFTPLSLVRYAADLPPHVVIKIWWIYKHSTRETVGLITAYVVVL